MFNSIYPEHKKPLLVRTGTDYKYTKIAVDRVYAADGKYHVLFLGTGKRNAINAKQLNINIYLPEQSVCVCVHMCVY